MDISVKLEISSRKHRMQFHVLGLGKDSLPNMAAE